MKIGIKLTLIIGILVIIGIAASGTVFYFIGKQAVEERVEAQLESVAVLKRNQLNYFFEGEMLDIEMMAADSSFVSDYLRMEKAHITRKDEEILHQNMRELLKEKTPFKARYFIEFFILDLDGKVYLSTDEAQEGKIKSNEPCFIEGKRGTFVQSFYYSLALQQPSVVISTPINDREGSLVGILAGRVNLEKISDIMLETSGLGETGETYLVNKFNYMVTGPRFEKGLALKKAVYSDAVKDCLKGNDGYGIYSSYRGNTVIGSYMWLPERKVCLLAEIDEKEAVAPVMRLGTIIIFVSIGLLFIIIVAGAILSRTISKPIITLHKGADIIASGNLEYRTDIRTKDEIGQLSRAFDEMAEKLEKSTEKLENQVAERTKELKAKVEELEKFQKFSVGRELKMVELKKKIRELEGKARK